MIKTNCVSKYYILINTAYMPILKCTSKWLKPVEVRSPYSHLPLFSASVTNANTTAKNCIASTRIQIPVLIDQCSTEWNKGPGSLQPNHYQVTVSYKHLWQKHHLHFTNITMLLRIVSHALCQDWGLTYQNVHYLSRPSICHTSYSKLWKMMYS